MCGEVCATTLSGKEVEMSTHSHSPAGAVPERGWASLVVREVWASVAITAMWVAVAVTAVWGPNLVTTSSGGSDSATIPSGVIVAFFAAIGSWAVAKYGFKRGTDQR
jgi:hypothetical protein